MPQRLAWAHTAAMLEAKAALSERVLAALERFQAAARSASEAPPPPLISGRFNPHCLAVLTFATFLQVS